MPTLTEAWLQRVARDISLPPLSPSVCSNVLPIVEAHIRQLLQQAYKFSKKANGNFLVVGDFNLALQSNKLEKVYGVAEFTDGSDIGWNGTATDLIRLV